MASSLPQHRGAVRRVVALAFVIAAVVLAGGVALLVYTATSVDKVQVGEERALVASYFSHHEREVVSDLRSVSVWDEAYEALSPRLDSEWADINVGGFYAEYLGHAVSAVLDAHGAPVYAWRGEGRAGLDTVASFLRDSEPLIRRVRQREAAAQAPGDQRLGLEGSIAESGVVRSDGQYFLVAVSNIATESSDIRRRPGPGYLVITAKHLGPEFRKSLEHDLRISDSRLGPARPQPAAAELPVSDVTGAVVGHLTWTPKRPGAAVMREALPPVLAAIVILTLAGLGLAARIRATFHELAANDRSLQRAMDELVRARDEADAANLAKSQFLANMSHEIRTPLNGVLGMTQVMAHDELSPAQRQRLEVVRDSGQTLLTLLNDILDISKIEAGKLEVDQHEFDLAAAVYAACNPFAGQADQKDVCFRIEIDEDAHGLWWGDGTRLRQVLSNLASNAVKFTGEGSVVVTVRRSPSGVAFTVRDTGIGIPPERLADLFQTFSQVDASTTRKFGGTGLGLAICRELVALMGGEITVESAAGQGSAFRFELPLEWRRPCITAPLATPAAHDRAGEAPLRILAAEDNATNQLILAALLEPFGVDLTLVGNGHEAVEAFSACRFDLVLMDVQMPVMNGVEAAAALRRLEAERNLPPTPILALSANVMTHQVAEYLAAGMTGFIPKPIEGAKLLAALEAALDQDPKAEAAA